MKPSLSAKLVFLAANPTVISTDPLTQEEIIEIFEEHDAIWLHDGNPKKPHAELTSGKCSNGYFNCSKVLCYPWLAGILARQLVQDLGYDYLQGVNWVIGSPYAAITFSYEVARILGAAHGFPEKDSDDPKKLVWKRWQIPKGARVLQVEELITTSGTTLAVRQAIEEGNSERVEFLSPIGALVHRPALLPISYAEFRVMALIEKVVWAVDPKDCELCKAGSPRLKPKTHWAELTGKA